MSNMLVHCTLYTSFLLDVAIYCFLFCAWNDKVIVDLHVSAGYMTEVFTFPF